MYICIYYLFIILKYMPFYLFIFCIYYNAILINKSNKVMMTYNNKKSIEINKV